MTASAPGSTSDAPASSPDASEGGACPDCHGAGYYVEGAGAADPRARDVRCGCQPCRTAGCAGALMTESWCEDCAFPRLGGE